MPPIPVIFDDFSAGWCASDDQVNGRKNALMRMDNVELDQNGALSLVGGCSVLGTYGSAAHTIWSNYLGTTRYDYMADANAGHIYRNGTLIASGGDSSNAAFGAAFQYNLIASGSVRKKDTGAALVDLGIGAPTAWVGANATVPNYTPGTMDFASLVFVTGSLISVSSASILVQTAVGGTQAVAQTFAHASVPQDLSAFVASTVNPATEDPNDVLSVYYVINDPDDSYELRFNLVAGNGAGDPVSDYYVITLDDTNGTQVFPFTYVKTIKRSDFARVGSGALAWADIYGVRLTYNSPANLGGAGMATGTFASYANDTYGNPFAFASQAYALPIGVYQYTQVNVNTNSGTYIGKSQIGPYASVNNAPSLAISGISVGPTKIIAYTTQTPTDAQVNQVWVFRKGVGLQQIYRIAVQTVGLWGTIVVDTVTDTIALETGITINPNLVSIAASSIPDKIYDIIGPIEGRWFYFTDNFMYPSDINDPDLVDASLAVRTINGPSEKFLWARKVGDASVFVGTSLDIHLLTGTFQTLPDFTVDIYYRTMGCKYPPIAYDASYAQGNVFYLAADGWRAFNLSGQNELLVAPNIDRVYQGETCYGLSASIKVAVGSTRFPCVVAKNQLWCGVAGWSRFDVYDFTRKYWKVVNYFEGTGREILAITSTQDGNILAYFQDSKMRTIDIHTTSLIDGATKNQIVLLSPTFNTSNKRCRNDLYTLKLRLDTGGDSLTCILGTDDGVEHTLGTLSSSGLSEKSLDAFAATSPSKWWYFKFTGSFSTLVISDISLTVDPRPEPLTALRIFNQNFGTASKKRVRVWPIVIDTRGANTTVTPVVDNSNLSGITVNTTEKTTVRLFYKTDAFGVDYGLVLTGTNFEFWEAMPPDIVQTLPIARQFDQVGPEELFRYGRIKQMELRVLPFGTSIPYTIYFNDNSTLAGSIATLSGLEQSFFIGLPMGQGGQIVRIVFGPTSFDFHRFYVRLQVMKTGKDTELEWITLPLGD